MELSINLQNSKQKDFLINHIHYKKISISRNIRIDLQNHQYFDQSHSNGIELVYGIASYQI